MKIEEGKFYACRDGVHAAGPMVWDRRLSVWRAGDGPWIDGDCWHENGRRFDPGDSSADLVHEVVKRTTSAVNARIAAYWAAHTGAEITAADVDTMLRLADVAKESQA